MTYASYSQMVQKKRDAFIYTSFMYMYLITHTKKTCGKILPSGVPW